MARVALVTGGTSGIGAATVRALAQAGLQVAILGRREGLGTALADEVASSGHVAEYFRCDVADAGSIHEAVDGVVDTWGRIDVLINNAGRYAGGSLEETEPEVWAAVLDVNLGGVYRVSRAAIPYLRAAGGGSIVNIASVHAYATQARVAAYAASKGAIVALTRQMAIDLATDRIRVNAVAVGGVDTDMAAESFRFLGTTASDAGWTADPGVLGRMGAPDEIAQVVAFLASPASSFVTGATLVADAGLLARI